MGEHQQQDIKKDNFSLTVFEAYCKKNPVTDYNMAIAYTQIIPPGHRVRKLVSDQLLTRVHSKYALPASIKTITDLAYYVNSELDLKI